MVQTVNQLLSLLTILAQGAILLSIVSKKVLTLFTNNALKLSFLIALVATSGSLFYSEIAGYEPCKLCWFQRIFMYPQVILLGMALWKKDKGVFKYSLALSVVGAAIAGYHYLLQIGLVPSPSCSAVGYSVSCSQRFVLQYGYITIPMMALTAFIFIALLSTLVTVRKEK